MTPSNLLAFPPVRIVAHSTQEQTVIPADRDEDDDDAVSAWERLRLSLRRLTEAVESRLPPAPSGELQKQ